MNITVYLGANEGNDPALKQAGAGAGKVDRGEQERAGVRRLPLRPDGRDRRKHPERRGKVTGVEPEFCAGRAAARGVDGADRDKGYD